jgi:hypothetical protein
MPNVASQLAIDNRLVRKHGTQILAIADYATAFPTTLWETGSDTFVVPKALPTGYRDMGYISTDGIQNSSDVSTSDVQAVQTTNPVRSDIDSIVKTLQVTLLEASAWVQGLAHGLPVSEWPEDKTAAYEYLDGDRSDFPYYRLLVLTQDGVGADAFYRIEGAFRAKVTDIGDRSLQRSDAEMFQRTFTCYQDSQFGATTVTSSTGVGDTDIPDSVLGGTGGGTGSGTTQSNAVQQSAGSGSSTSSSSTSGS